MGSAERGNRLALTTVGGYLALTLVPTIHLVATTHIVTPLLAHVSILILVGVAIGIPNTVPRIIRASRDWLPLVLMLFTYAELRWLIGAVGQPQADLTVRRWEAAFFPGDPSRTLAIRYHGLVLSEVLHLAYLSFYALVVVPPAILYVRQRRDAFASTVLSLTFVYVLSCVCFLAFPVDGPRYIFGPAAAPDGPIRGAVLRLLSTGSSPGTAFPSLHVSASVVASYCALRTQRLVGYGVTLLTAGVAMGAVYGGFHYGVDVMAGLGVGCLCAAAGEMAWRMIGGSA